jgi:hypothetical protein
MSVKHHPVDRVEELDAVRRIVARTSVSLSR